MTITPIGCGNSFLTPISGIRGLAPVGGAFSTKTMIRKKSESIE